MRHQWRWALLLILVVYELARLPLPGIPGAPLSLKDVLVALGIVVCGGKTLYDTLFRPRGPWGTHP
ncbi:MAG: hypothetical protein HY321_21060 [Armatimonadetes bacterium]|nr:hypothetical protein [Armatimonadota bacterium]